VNTEVVDQSVLLVEDNPSDAELYRTMVQQLQADGLTTTRTISVDHVGTVEAAVEAVDGDAYDAVLLDLNLPDSGGAETLDRMLTVVGSAAVVVLTGAGDEEMGTRAVARGAQDFLIKDRVTPRVLVKTISYAIERKRQAQTLERQRRRLAALNWLVRHDIRNDAAVILGWADAVDPDDPAERRALSRIVDAGRNIVDSTESAGALVEALDGTQDTLAPVHLQAVVEEEVTRLMERYDDVAVIAETPPADVAILADRFLGVVLRSLLENAVVHNTAEEPRVTVDVETTPEAVTVVVADNGQRISETTRVALADADVASDRTDLGLGLFLVGTFADRYGATLEITETDAGGTRVCLGFETPET
jgi:signal transduction histidine kinase